MFLLSDTKLRTHVMKATYWWTVMKLEPVGPTACGWANCQLVQVNFCIGSCMKNNFRVSKEFLNELIHNPKPRVKVFLKLIKTSNYRSRI